jgi:RNA polymerase sigma factor (sigma-70 family)
MVMNVRPESDEALIQRLLPHLNCNPEDRATAWSEWYAGVGEASVLSFIKAKNDTAELDHDILQEAMLTAFVELERGRYQPRAGVPFTAYVKGIARNKIREARRRTWRFVAIDDTPESLLESNEPELEAVIERQEASQTLQIGLARLPNYRRQVLEGYLNGGSTTEIAETLEMSEELVRQHKSRGLRSLREVQFFSWGR